MSWERRIKPWSLAGCRRGTSEALRPSRKLWPTPFWLDSLLAHGCCLVVISKHRH